ncbi:MAG TPA: tRNA-dihydrouridine synthase family protein [Planctomycetota bacterium]|nr:tRNA-dihydrouridine synthase family protein [Planctomycetota bacterium]
MNARLPFTSPWLLAPMEGITEPCFRDLVLARNPASALGGAYTEFVRVVDQPLPAWKLREHLGPNRFETPVGLQLMGSDLGALAATAQRAVLAGAPLVDLNFGCPAKGAIADCSGSGMLRDPARLERTVRAVAEALPGVPVTAKIRAGFDDDQSLPDLARAAEAGGAQLLTVHCRTRKEAYCEQVDWTRIARAVSAVRIPVCGNGSVTLHADLERMRRETGAQYAMVGRGALADPWVFSGHRASAREAAEFLLEYAEILRERHGAKLGGRAARVKQLLRYWTAGDLLGPDRAAWLRESDPARLFARLWAAGGLEERAASSQFVA